MNNTVISYTVICLTYITTNDREIDHQRVNPDSNIRNVNRDVLNCKSNYNIGTWNVHTMYITSKTAHVIKEMKNESYSIVEYFNIHL